ncbi:hypothetical protein LTR66_016996 [Elasticomyces elasticus]|nr:hypothetical protein LTR66_016996 [Elasticomyces elasticus]
MAQAYPEGECFFSQASLALDAWQDRWSQSEYKQTYSTNDPDSFLSYFLPEVVSNKAKDPGVSKEPKPITDNLTGHSRTSMTSYGTSKKHNVQWFKAPTAITIVYGSKWKTTRNLSMTLFQSGDEFRRGAGFHPAEGKSEAVDLEKEGPPQYFLETAKLLSMKLGEPDLELAERMKALALGNVKNPCSHLYKAEGV